MLIKSLSFIMASNNESTSSSIKFVPLRMADLLPKLPSLKPIDSPDTSFSSEADTDDSFEEVTSKTTKVTKTPDKPSATVETVVLRQGKSVDNKENYPFVPHTSSRVEDKPLSTNASRSDNESISNQTYPSKAYGAAPVEHIARPARPYPNSEIKKRNVLTPRNNFNIRPMESSKKRTPNTSKALVTGVQKTSKTATPKLKTGIRKFTPGSGRSARRNTPLKPLAAATKDRGRCLFPEQQSQDTMGSQPPEVLHSVPDTPVQRKQTPMITMATPSHPQTASSQPKMKLKSINIKGKGYMLIKKLGTGGSSEVFKVLEVGGTGEFAVKCVNLAVERGLAQSYINEIRLLKDLQSSDRVIRLYDYEYDKVSQSLKVVLEVGETDLSSFLKARGDAGLPPALVLYYWQEMLHAVHHIHEHGVIHADLKPANFLLVCGRLKLIDFGIASSISADATSVVRPYAAGTFSYISPEALMGGAGGYNAVGRQYGDAPIKISFRSDVWSLGCILYSMVYGRTPFSHILHVYAKISAIIDPNHHIDYPPAISKEIPPALITALQWCLTYNAKSRPSVRELLAFPYQQAPNIAQVPLPQNLLDKLRPHITTDEYQLLLKAKV